MIQFDTVAATGGGSPIGLALVWTTTGTGGRTYHTWRLTLNVRAAAATGTSAAPGYLFTLWSLGATAIGGAAGPAPTGITVTPTVFAMSDFTLTEGDDGFVSSLEFTLDNPGATIAAWTECILTIDPDTAYEDNVFGGYITQATPEYREAGATLRWRCTAEGYETLINRVELVRKTYISQTVAAIVSDLFTLTGLTTFDASTHVTTGPTLTVFSTEGEPLGSVLSRLTEISGQRLGATWVWKVDADKALWLGAASSAAAPYELKQGVAADYSTSYPAEAGTVKIDTDASDIRNDVTVRGGVGPSPVQTETFTGDGSTLQFALRYKPVRQIGTITLAGVRQNHGTDWYDEFGSGYDCLVNYRAGTVRFPEASPPPATSSLVVTYRYDLPIVARVQDQDSYDTYGLWFRYEVQDRSITAQDDAEDLANAVLNQYAFGVVSGSLRTRQWGLRAGQAVTLTFATIGLSGTYAIRKMTYTRTATQPVGECQIEFGGRPTRFSQAFGGGQTTIASGYGAATTPRASGEVQDWYIRGDLYAGVGDDVFRVSSTNNIYIAWAGAADADSAPWSLTRDGEMTTTQAIITGGELTAFTITPTKLVSGDFEIDAVNRWIRFKSTYLYGSGIDWYDGDLESNRGFHANGALTGTSFSNAGLGNIYTGAILSDGSVYCGAALQHAGATAGFFATAPTTKPTVTGSRGGNAALASLLTGLATLGLVTDSTSA